MILFYRIYQLIILLPVTIVSTILAAVLTVAGCAVGIGHSAGYVFPMTWARIMCWFTLVKVTVRGHENIDPATSYVFVANHQGSYDIFSVYGYLGHNFRWMMKKSLEKIPFVGWACRRCGQIFVDNSSPHAIAATMQAAKKQLAGGMSLVVFPEGARTFNGQMGRFKRGAYTLAVEFGMPVVPITIDGAFKVMPRTAKLPRWGHITLTIHKPIYPGIDGHDLASLMEKSREAIASALPR